jgi:phospholipid/cholesterol/gamma-HCH transport system substrate-binding protein
MRKSAIDVWVGIFVAIGMLAMLFLALKVGNMSAVSFAPTYSVSARFDNIGGLKPRAPVKSAGVVVGRIANIKFDDTTYQATVTMIIEGFLCKNLDLWIIGRAIHWLRGRR